MANRSRREFLASIPAAVNGVAALKGAVSDGPASSEYTLWYRQPAAIWTDALPIGNGRLGAMVFGGTDTERLQINEDTLWSGAPRAWNNANASDVLPEIRRLVLDEQKYHEADALCKKMQGPYNESYQPLGDLYLKAARATGGEEYRRELDLDTAIARVTYTSAGIACSREMFSSAVDQVIVVRLTCGKPGLVSFTASLDSRLQHASTVVGGNMLRMSGKAPSHVVPNYVKSEGPVLYDIAEGKGMRFECWVRVLPEGGQLRVDGNSLAIEGANAVTILIAAGTGYKGYDKVPDTQPEVIASRCRARIDAASRSLTRRCGPATFEIIRRCSGECRLISAALPPVRCLPMKGLHRLRQIRLISNCWRSTSNTAAIC